MKTTNDLLVARPITSTSGQTSVLQNIGSIENKGFEFSFGAGIVQPSTSRGFSWNSDFNIAFNDNKVKKLYLDQPFTSGIRDINRVEVGQPLGAFYAIKFLGVDPATGDAMYEDKNGDGDINSGDRQILGSPHPDYTGGFSNSLAWMGFDVKAFLQFSQGAEIFNGIRIFADDGGYYNDNKFIGVMDRWRQPGDVTNQPRASYDGLSNARQVSSRYIEDGSYIRIQEVTLGYRLPERWSSLLKLQAGRVFLSGRNLKTFTNYSGYSPDVNSNGSSANISLGTEFYAYPRARSWMFGINGSW